VNQSEQRASDKGCGFVTPKRSVSSYLCVFSRIFAWAYPAFDSRYFFEISLLLMQL